MGLLARRVLDYADHSRGTDLSVLFMELNT